MGLKWKTKSGDVIEVADMTDHHLNNAITMLERQADNHHANANYGIAYWGNPDSMGAYYAEQQGFEELDKALAKERWIEALKAERDTRLIPVDR